MTYQLPISARYRKAIFEAVALQVIIGVLSGLVLDSGTISRICAITMLGFWGGAILTICRRPHSPTRADIELIRFGYLGLLALAYFLVQMIWTLRGVL